VLNKLAGQNAKRHRQHKPLRHLTITVAERITPLRGAKPRTVVKRIKVAPLRHH